MQSYTMMRSRSKVPGRRFLAQLAARWSTLMRGDIVAWRELGRLRQAATELAFQKRKLAQRGHDPATQKDIDRYRLRLAELGATRGWVDEG